ncbi:hypothetical protein O6P43_006826 [Quillaja saponaria]|uniref:RNase H type-1 domain-containing protein n=1 Tax=Quillaja saponaria TaxID=32244 RepID=A0AAD7Q9H6_QUISA|nr:hypothetical protein O6P43_006826 [Quillaja saponaria]
MDCARNRGSVGFVARNSDGRVVGAGANLVDSVTDPAAVLEDMTLRAAATFANNQGWQSITLEGDSKNVVDAAVHKDFNHISCGTTILDTIHLTIVLAITVFLRMCNWETSRNSYFCETWSSLHKLTHNWVEMKKYLV